VSLGSPWAIEIKKVLSVMAYNKARVFSRYARALPKRLQDVQTDNIIMIYKPYRQALQYHAIV
jgi:ABC-type transport system involved in Fe-S cluster assembly fused permease/ATPase subunit